MPIPPFSVSWPSSCLWGFPGACGAGDLGQEESLEKGLATQSSSLAWRTPRTEEPGGPQSTRSQRVERHLSNEHFYAFDNFVWVLLFLVHVDLWTFIACWHLLCLFFLIFLYKIDMALLLLLTTKFKDYTLNPLGRSIREITVFVMQIL